MQQALARYRAFVFQPNMPRLLALLFIARMPVGMLSLSTLLFAREVYGSFAPAGSLVGAYLIAAALSAPPLGRIIDRVGPQLPSRVTGVAQPIAVIAMILCIQFKAPFLWTLICSGLAGLMAPPVTAVTRAVWRQRFTHDEERKTAFSFDSVMIELNFTLGPALVATVVALVNPRAAIYLALAAVVISCVAFNLSSIFDDWQREPIGERHWLGPLTDSALLRLLFTVFGLTFSFGVLEVLYPAYGTQIAAPALGGVLIAINSMGSGIAGFAYGGVTLPFSLPRQYAALLSCMALAMAAHALPLGPWAFAVVALVGGVFISPGITAHTLLVARTAKPEYATEAFTWSSTCILTGISAGTALTGWMIEKHSIAAAALMAASVLVVSALAALTLQDVNA